MKALLCPLALLFASVPAPAQTSMDGPTDVIGVFFDLAGTQTDLQVTPGVPFNVYVLAAGMPVGAAGYEFRVELPSQVTILNSIAHPAGNTLNFGSGPESFIVGLTNGCISGPGYQLLAELQCLVTQPVGNLLVTVGPVTPSSFNGESAGYAECGSFALFPYRQAYVGAAILNPLDPGFNLCSSAVNSTGDVAHLFGWGDTSVSAPTFHLGVTELPPYQPGFFIMSQNTAALPFWGGYDGTLCVGAPNFRFNPTFLSSGPDGGVVFRPDYANLPDGQVFVPGHTWYFQYWTRDRNPRPTWNSSEAYGVFIHY